MKSFFVLAVATVIAAQDGGYFPGEPSCAIPCLTSAISKAGCPLSDISCQCGPTQTAIAANVAGCLISNCGAGDLAQAQSAGLAVCSSLSAGKLTITSTAASTGSATESGSMSITRGPSTTGSGSESLTVTESGHTIINETVGGTGTDTGKTLTATVVNPTVSTSQVITASASGNSNAAAATPAVAKVVGGILVGALGIVAAL